MVRKNSGGAGLWIRVCCMRNPDPAFFYVGLDEDPDTVNKLLNVL